MIEAIPKEFQNANVPILAPDDGGLAIRQMFRGVKDAMEARENRGKKMLCGVCIELQKADKHRSVRKYATWFSLRDHLINYHRVDSREVPE